jgi:hypothetical protein
VGSVAAYLALVAVVAGVGRRKTALLLLALFILLPAYAAALGLFLVLALLVAALPPESRPWKTAERGCFTLLPGALVALGLLGVLDDWTRKGVVWTYPAVLVPLIVLALAGWKKAALRLLIPCLLLLVYLNWPLDESWRTSITWGYHYNDKGYLLNFARLEPAPGSGPSDNGSLLPYEAWDWSGWYWLWPIQLASWGLFGWAVVLVGGAELVRWDFRNARRGAP